MAFEIQILGIFRLTPQKTIFSGQAVGRLTSGVNSCELRLGNVIRQRVNIAGEVMVKRTRIEDVPPRGIWSFDKINLTNEEAESGLWKLVQINNPLPSDDESPES